jgi:hypothetical protein
MTDNTTLSVELEGEKPVEIEIPADSLPAPEPKEPEKSVAAPVEVSVGEEEPEAPQPQPAAPQGDPAAVAELRSQLLAMERRAEIEARRREQAEYDARAMAAQADRNRRDGLVAQGHAIINALHAEQADAENLKREMREASTAQEFDRVGEINMKLGEIGTRIAELKAGRAQIEGLLKKPLRDGPQGPRPEVPQVEETPRTPVDPVEAFISNLTPRSQNFVRNRDRSWVADPKLNDKLRAAHSLAIADGIEHDSDAYFTRIDEIMGHKKPEPTPAPQPAPTVQKKAAPIPAAPASHKGASTIGASGGAAKVILSPRQQEAAKNLGISLAEYGRRVHLMSQPNGHNGLKLGQQGN